MKKSKTSSKRFSHGAKNFSDGSKYVGQLKDDKRDGQGIHTLANGDKYEGKWKDDKRNGHGTVTSSSGDKFVGEWKNDDKQGFGAVFHADGLLAFSGQWQNGSYVNEVKRSKDLGGSIFKAVVRSTKILAVSVFIFLIIILGSVFFQISDQELHAAVTQPQLLIKKVVGKAAVIECNCERTLDHFEISADFKTALKYIEDRRFENHFGVDPRSFLRAIKSFGRAGGGSTLEMQLVKNTVVQPEQDLFRKFNEAIFALRLSRIFSKSDILRLYLSKVNFGRFKGNQIVGLRAAASAYFDKKPSEINFFESSILLGIINGPSIYNPIRHPKKSLVKADLIAKTLAKKGYLKYSGISELEKHMPKRIWTLPVRHRFIEDYVLREFQSLDLGDGTYRVITTIDAISQNQARRVVKAEINKFIKRSPKSGVERAALISIDEFGAIKAMFGGRNYQKSQYNLAVDAQRQPASTAKISTYLAALEKGLNKKTIVYDDRKKIKNNFKPKNYDHKYKGRISLGKCLAQSRNACTYYLAETLVGFPQVSEMSHRLGLSAKSTLGKNIVLGTAETTLIKNTSAFSTIKNAGIYHTPFVIRFVMSKYGRVEHATKVEKKRLFSSEVSNQMQDLLAKVVDPQGTANKALIPGHKTFGKTGTSQNYRDAWFVGFTEHTVTTGIWVGPREEKYMNGVTGGSLPAKIFRQFNRNLYERLAQCGGVFSSISAGYARDINC